MNKFAKSVIGAVSLALAGLLTAAPAQAVPKLQLYIEGAEYDAVGETWILGGINQTFKLWVIGNPANGKAADITDLHLIAAYGDSNGTGNITIDIMPTTTGDTLFTDPSTPDAPIWEGETADGSIPLMNNGTNMELPSLSMPPHGVYGTETYWQRWDLNDDMLVSEIDSPIADFIGGFPSSSNKDGIIHAYEITISGQLSGSSIHFDVYGTQDGSDVFAPFSHDAATVAEPGTLAILSLGLVGLAMARRKKRKLA